MPLIVANTVVDLNNKKEVVNKISLPSEPPPQKISTEVLQEGHHLIVNGKQKKVSKMSAYLLDMFTTDSE